MYKVQVCTLLLVVATIHNVFYLFSWIFCTDGISLSLSIFIILIGYYGLKQKELFSNPENESFVLEQKPGKYAGSGLKEPDARLYLEKLKNYMATEKPYLNPDLNLQKLSKEVDIPTHYFTQLINESMCLNRSLIHI